MDIFKWADELDWTADYYDSRKCQIYKICDARFIGNRNEITVVDALDGKVIGVVRRNN